MSGAFDPYHRWLGIPAKEQPPNHYRLLGLEVLEDDPEVIRDAVEQRMAHVRTYQLGQYVALSQRILNELATAKACLLDPTRKALYDVSLRTKAKPSTQASVPSLPPSVAVTSIRPVKPPEVPVSSELAEFLDEARKPLPLKRRSVRHGKLLWAAAGVAAVLLMIGLAVATSGNRQSTEPREATPVSPQLSPQALASAGSNGPKAPATTVARAPKLARISDTAIDEGNHVRLKVVVADHGSAEGKLRFGLAEGAPTRATINATTGVFMWTPTKEEGPGEYPITVRVAADGSENLSDETTFRITVQKRARSLTLRPIQQRTVIAGRTIRFTVSLMSSVEPTDEVVFSLPEAPPWVTIDVAGGEVMCAPPEIQAPGPYNVTVRAANDAAELMQDEKTFVVMVVRPAVIPAKQTPRPGYSAAPAGDFKINLPSGQVLSSAALNIQDRVRREIEKLKGPRAYFFLQEGSESAIAARFTVKGEKPDGPAVFFHPYQVFEVPLPTPGARPVAGRPVGVPVVTPPHRTEEIAQPKQYVNYRDGKWHGELATWDPDGQREFWCSYKNGKRDGLCCLFNNDVLTTVLECVGDKIKAVHLVAENQVTESLTDVDQAYAHDVIGPMLKKINTIEQGLKTEDRLFCDRVKAEVRRRIANINQQRSDADSARRDERARQQDQGMKAIQNKAMGH